MSVGAGAADALALAGAAIGAGRVCLACGLEVVLALGLWREALLLILYPPQLLVLVGGVWKYRW